MQIHNLGLRPYQEIWDAMRACTAARDADSADQIWLVQHPPVYTQGQAGKPEHLLAPGDIPVIQIDRGGQITYHGPGQTVMYLTSAAPASASAHWSASSKKASSATCKNWASAPNRALTPPAFTWTAKKSPRSA